MLYELPFDEMPRRWHPRLSFPTWKGNKIRYREASLHVLSSFNFLFQRQIDTVISINVG